MKQGPERAETLETAQSPGMPGKKRVHAFHADLPKRAKSVDELVNATVLGRQPDKPTHFNSQTHLNPLKAANSRKTRNFWDVGGNFDRKFWMHFLGSKITFGEIVKNLVKYGEFSEYGRSRPKSKKGH